MLALVLLLSTSSLAQEVAIRAGHLIDPATGTVAKNQIILSKDGKIVEVGSRVEIPNTAETVDLSTAWVMPGLMDAHTHLTFNIPPSAITSGLMSAYLNESSGLRALRGMQNAQLVLQAGFTTVKDIGNDANYAAIDVRRAIERGWFSGPTMLTTGKIIAAFGGQSTGIPPEQGPFWQFEYLDADTPDEVRKAVRRNIYYGANAIKLVADNNAYFYSQDEIRAAVTEAHSAGLTVTVHVFGGEAARNVILGGADAIEHGFNLSDDLLKLMKEKGTVLVGTDFPEAHLQAMGFNPVIEGKTMGERIVDRLARAYKLGVKMAFGTDTVVDLPNKNRAEMAMDYLEVWVAAGVPPAQILKCMTTNAAELFQIQKHRGAIAAGLAADLIATPENPLENIQALRKVSFVMKDGKVIKRLTEKL
jgi:imidazolonepropionase-like amidohydrolase